MPILTPDERLGTLIDGKYRVHSVLGEGGMGVVFSGEHMLTGRKVAIKMLLPERAGRDDLTKRFLREARAAARLEHPNVVDVLDTGVDEDGSVYLVLELLRGESLGELLDRHVVLGPERTVQLMLPVMRALTRAHEAGIVHRDLKPDNIYLSHREGEVTPKLLDFGIAKILDEGSSFATRTGMVMGTPHYMAPEQARGVKEIGPAVDQWALGVILFECLCAEFPFEADNATAVIAEILTTSPRRLEEVAPEVPRPIADVVQRALSVDVDDRFADVGEMAAALRDAATASGFAEPKSASQIAGWSVPPPRDPPAPTLPSAPTALRESDSDSGRAPLDTDARTVAVSPSPEVGESDSPRAVPREVDGDAATQAREARTVEATPAPPAAPARGGIWLPLLVGASVSALIGAAVVIMMRPDPSSIAPPPPLTNAERAEVAPEPPANVVRLAEPEPVAIVATDPEPTEPAEEVTETPQEPQEAPRRRRGGGQASEEVPPPPPPRTTPTESEPDPMELRDQW